MESRIPSRKAAARFVVQYLGAGLLEQVGASRGPLHLRCLTKRLLTTWVMGFEEHSNRKPVKGN